jgi:transposase
MRTPTKFVAPLTDSQRQRLKEIQRTDANWRTRSRAHAVLLSEKGFALDQLATIFELDRDTISQWLDWWEQAQFAGLADDPRSGRPPILATAPKKTKR